ncbi:MAG: TolC family protein [Opitutaceae bacterium]
MLVRVIRLLGVGLLAVPVIVRSQSPSNLPPLPEDLIPPLRTILVSALGQSPQMIAQNINITQAEAIRIQNAAAMWPSMNAYVNYTSTNTSVSSSVTSSNSGIFYTLSVYQPIYQWGALKARADSGKIGIKIAEHQYADAYRLLVVSLRTQFLGLVAKKIALRNAGYALKQAEEGLALAQEKLKAGRISNEEIMEPNLAVDDARLARDRAQEDLDNSLRLLRLTVGQSDFNVADIPEGVPQPVYDLEVVVRLLQDFVRTGAEETYQALVYRDYVKQADLDYRIARVNLLPKFAFSASLSQQNYTSAATNYVSQIGISSNSWNIVANWSIFDGFATRGAKLSALTRKRTYERALRTTANQTLAQAQDLAKQLDFAWRYLQLRQTRRDMSETQFKRAEDNLKLGQTSQTAVNTAELAFYSSELTLASARGDFLNGWSQYLSTLCIDPMISQVPAGYLKDGK